VRQVVLDTETTGLEPDQGHRVIELGGVEIVDRKLTGKSLHEYINPERDIEDGAFGVHGVQREFLSDKPKFAEVADALLDFVDGAEVIIHNAPFDLAFLDYELSLLGRDAVRNLTDICTVVDSLALARRKHPGQKNGLDALCRRYGVDDSARELHGALLDAEILADVYLKMTGGQTSLFGDEDALLNPTGEREIVRLPEDRPPVPVRYATADELHDHEAYLDGLDKAVPDGAVWRRRDSVGAAIEAT